MVMFAILWALSAPDHFTTVGGGDSQVPAASVPSGPYIRSTMKNGPFGGVGSQFDSLPGPGGVL
jgi:hypothetical protein